MSVASDKSQPKEWRWIDPAAVHAVHDRQLAKHGGPEGIRDAAAIESALARPLDLSHRDKPDSAGFAAACTHGIARNPGFVEGNKRIAWIAAHLFLADNRYRLRFDQPDAFRTMSGVAGGTVSESELARWFRDRPDTGE